MKNLFCISLFLTNFCFCQGIDLGIKGGLNYTNFSGKNIEGLDFRYATNFHLGAAVQVEFNANFKLQADFLYNIVGTEVKTLTTQYDNKLGYISIPIALKLAVSSRKAFLETGAQASYLVNENQQNLKAIQTQNWSDVSDFDLGVFLGFSYHLNESLFLQARYHWGLTEVTKIDSQSFKNQGASLSIGYYLF